MTEHVMRIAIIGTGIAGLTLTHQLKHIANITLFEKARGVSGRMSTRTAGEFQFDHGAQYFTARSTAFQNFLHPHINSGLIKPWTPKLLTLEMDKKPYKRDWFEPHYVAVPGMNALAKNMAQGFNIKLQTQIIAITKVKQVWQLTDQHQHQYGPFDWVLCTAPAPQTYQLMPAEFTAKDLLLSVKHTPCFSLMLGFDAPLNLNFEAAEVKNSPISWISINAHKPERSQPFTLLIQTHPDWTQAHINDDPAEVPKHLLKILEQLLTTSLAPTHIALHRWLYAGTSTPLEQDFLMYTEQHLGVCGDWCIDGRVEGGFLSALRLAEMLNK